MCDMSSSLLPHLCAIFDSQALPRYVCSGHVLDQTIKLTEKSFIGLESIVWDVKHLLFVILKLSKKLNLNMQLKYFFLEI